MRNTNGLLTNQYRDIISLVSLFIHLKKLQNYERCKDYWHCYSNCHFNNIDWGFLPCIIDYPFIGVYLCNDIVTLFDKNESGLRIS